MKLTTDLIRKIVREELNKNEAIQLPKGEADRLAGALPGGKQAAADRAAEKARASSPEMQKKREEWTSQVDPKTAKKPIGHLAVTGQTMEEEMSMEETLQEWEKMEEGTPPPVPGSAGADKRARLDAIAKKVQGERDKAATAKAANPAMQKLDAISHKVTDRDNPQTPFAEETSFQMNESELLALIGEVVKEVIQEKKKSGKKLPPFLMKKNKDKDKKSEKKQEKK